MNKKCGKCGFFSDKCKNSDSLHYDKFREKDDRCSIKIKTPTIHLFSYDHYVNFPIGHIHRNNATKCGYVREYVTTDVDKVTCKLCLKKLNR